MKCKHCRYVFEKDKTVCPNCGKSIYEEPEVKLNGIELPITKKTKKVEEPEIVEKEIVIEEPKEEKNESNEIKEDVVTPVVDEKIETEEKTKKTSKIEMTAEDEFITNFIAKDDALKKMETEAPKGNAGMMVARIAALISVLFFAGVMYYTKVILPQIKPTQRGGTTEIIDEYETTSPSSSQKKSTGIVELKAEFNEETIITQLKKFNYEYNKDMDTVDITLDYGKLLGGQTFKVKLNRTNDEYKYSDNIYFVYQDAKILGLSRDYTNYNEDLITNMINSYVVKEFDGGVIMYSTASTFQLGHSNPILVFKNGKINTVEKVITTYSTDGASISQCPITLKGDTVTYCAYVSDFKKGENIELRNMAYQFDKEEIVTGTFQGMISK